MENYPILSDRLTLSIDEAQKASGLSRSTLYVAIRNGELGSVKVAGRRLIPVAALRQFLRLED
ncbi:helix-turn-helix domain-containing protein [Prosthecomicrobium sp. N25]|uniref:helix-turn-helix domain-containing protein n=1 Tax=Prosthecomicrobium sp. N25 TaxID=3129254 RepID=UPI00307709CD